MNGTLLSSILRFHYTDSIHLMAIFACCQTMSINILIELIFCDKQKAKCFWLVVLVSNSNYYPHGSNATNNLNNFSRGRWLPATWCKFCNTTCAAQIWQDWHNYNTPGRVPKTFGTLQKTFGIVPPCLPPAL